MIQEKMEYGYRLRKQLKRWFLSSVLMISVAAQGIAQSSSGIIAGHIHTEDGTPVAFASLMLRENGKKVGTDSEGKYEFTALQPGKYTVVVSSIGFRSEEKSAALHAADRITMDFV